VISAAAGLALGGCGGPRKGQSAATLVVGLETELRGFDPLKAGASDIFAGAVSLSMLSRLMSFDASGALRPELAMAMEPGGGGRIWRVDLRDDIVFQDGEPFDAKAVVHHFDRILTSSGGCPCRSYLQPLRSVGAAGPYAVDLHLEHPWPALSAALAEPSTASFIGSPRALRDDRAGYNRGPVGTGPFRFVEWRAGSHISVERNPSYTVGPAPHLEEIEFRFLPDQESRFAAVRSGDVDVIWSDRPDQVLLARRDPDLRVDAHTGSGAVTLILNTAVPPLDDVRVRRAIAYATDRELLSRALDEGLRPPATGPFGPGSPYACPDGNGYPPYDLSAAKRLLAEYGRPVHLNLMSTATPRGRETGLVFQDTLRKAGFDVAVQITAAGVFTQRALAGQFQVAAWRFNDISDPDLMLYEALHSRSETNLTGWRSPEADRLLDLARQSASPEVRRTAYCDLSRLMATEMPVIYRYHPAYFAIRRREVAGIPPLRSGVLDVTGAWLEGKPA
jgi:4-phytase/acid phosphatase/peptide/nickel transport system substrate-binding protein